MILNGLNGTTLKRFNIEEKYRRKIIRGNLLREGNDYNSFEFSNYKSTIKKGLSKDLGKKVLIRERNLDFEIKKKLMKKYAM